MSKLLRIKHEKKTSASTANSPFESKRIERVEPMEADNSSNSLTIKARSEMVSLDFDTNPSDI